MSRDDRGGMTLEECGEVMGVTRERIRQVEKKALAKLRAALEAEGLTLEDLINERGD